MPIYMVITDQNNNALTGEAQVTVTDPYLGRNVVNPVEIQDLSDEFENTYTFGTGGSGAGKVQFDPLTVSKVVDKVSQNLFAAVAAGTVLKYVDLLVVKPGQAGGTAVLKPYLSVRLGTVVISDLRHSADEEQAREDVTFIFGQYQIGYQQQKADGTYTAFAPVGWDRIRNVRI